MFNVEEIIGIKEKDTARALETIGGTILLVADALDDTIKKINRLGYKDIPNAQFINGYAVLDNGSFISKKGKIITPERKIKGQFSCDRIQCEGGFIDGLTGKMVLKTDVLDTKPFVNNLAPVKISQNEWVYVSKNDEDIYSGISKYEEASCFFSNYAIVCNGYSWSIIDTGLKYIVWNIRSEYTKEQLEGIMKFFDNNPCIYKKDNISVFHKGENTIFIDNDTGFSIRVYEVLERLYQALRIPKIEGTIKEQLAFIINEASTRGTLAMNLDTFKIYNVEVVKGIKIKDCFGGSAVSFDSPGIELTKSRIAPEMKEGK